MTTKQQQDFREKVWAILMVENRAAFDEARKQKDEINALIDQGNENEWDAESVAWAIIQGCEG